MCIQIAPLLFQMIHILYVIFCIFLSSKNRNHLIPKNLKKMQHHLLSNFHKKSKSVYIFIYSVGFYFLLYKKKKVLVSSKFSISSFWWIYTFWDALITIWLFLENVCLSVRLSVCLPVFVHVCMWQKFCGKYSSRTKAQNFVKLYI